MNPDKDSAEKFAKAHSITPHTDYDAFLQDMDLVYVATLHLTHYEYVKMALLADKHVTFVLPQKALELYGLAEERNLVLLIK